MQDVVRRQLDEIRQALDQLEETLSRPATTALDSDLALLIPMLELSAAITPAEVVELTIAAAAQGLPDTAGAFCLLTDDEELTLEGVWDHGRTWLAQHPGVDADLPDHFAARPLADALRLPVQLHSVQTGELRIWGELERMERGARLLASSAGMALGGLAMKRRIDQRLTQDPLTGLSNQRYLIDTLQREIHRASRNKSSVSLMLLDLDDFTAFNRRLGNEQGDRMLQAVAGVLQASFRGSDVCSRMHGQRFGVLLPDAALEDARRRAGELLALIASLRVAGHADIQPKVSACAGIAAFPAHADTPAALLDGAEAALHLAKQRGPGSVCVAQREEQA
jgi:diguanylate cyclase (GGDEF)-like protein